MSQFAFGIVATDGSRPKIEHSAMVRISRQKQSLDFGEKLAGLVDCDAHFCFCDRRLEAVVCMKPPVESVEQEAVKLLTDPSLLDEVLPKKSVNASMLVVLRSCSASNA